MERLLVQLARSVEGTRTLEELARPLLAVLQSVTGLDATYLTAVDPMGAEQRVLFARTTGAVRVVEGSSTPWRDAPCRHALEEARLQVDDADARWGGSAVALPPGVRTFATVPVRTSDGGLCGTLCAAGRERHVLDADAEHAMRLVAHLLAQRFECDRLAERLATRTADLAAHALADPLTGLPNRRALEPELSRMLARVQRDDRALVVAHVDLPAHAAVVARDGHDAADRFLVAMSQRLEASLRGGDLVARIGEHTFAVAGAIARESAEAAAAVLRERLAAALDGTVDVGNGRRVATAGTVVGVVLARTGEIDAAALLARVDLALHGAARTG